MHDSMLHSAIHHRFIHRHFLEDHITLVFRRLERIDLDTIRLSATDLLFHPVDKLTHDPPFADETYCGHNRKHILPLQRRP